MKCPRCHGMGKITEWVATDTVSEYKFPCRKCNGTGEIEVTNEEWFCQLSTKEKAHELYRRCNYASIFGSPTQEDFEKWLKDVHKE